MNTETAPLTASSPQVCATTAFKFAPSDGGITMVGQTRFLESRQIGNGKSASGHQFLRLLLTSAHPAPGTGLSGMVQTVLHENPFSGHVFLFRGRRGDLIKMLWFDGDGLCLFAKRLERGRFIWPQATSGTVSLTPAQLSMLLEGIDWRRPVRTAPQMAV
jgi:transposase